MAYARISGLGQAGQITAIARALGSVIPSWTSLGLVGASLVAWKTDILGRLFNERTPRIQPDPNSTVSLQYAIQAEVQRLAAQQQRLAKETNITNKARLATDIQNSYGLLELYNKRLGSLRSPLGTQRMTYDQMLQYVSVPDVTIDNNGLLVPIQHTPNTLQTITGVLGIMGGIAGALSQIRGGTGQFFTAQPTAQTSQIPMIQQIPVIVSRPEPTPIPVRVPESTFQMSNILVPSAVMLSAIVGLVMMGRSTGGK